MIQNLSSCRDEFQREMVNLVSDFCDNITKGMIDNLSARQDKFSLMLKENEADINNLRGEKERLKCKLSATAQERDNLQAIVKIMIMRSEECDIHLY